MTEQDILDLITREGQPELDLNWDKLTQRFAHQLAAISHKLNRDDLAENDAGRRGAPPEGASGVQGGDR